MTESKGMKVEAITGLSVIGATWFKMFAQQTGVDPGVASLIGNFGIMGVLIWYLWYNTTVAQPKLVDRFAAEAAAIRQAFDAEQRLVREAFDGEQRAQRSTFEQEQRALREYAGKEMTELRAMLMRAIEESRRAVHDMRDTAQTAVTQAALAAHDKGGRG